VLGLSFQRILDAALTGADWAWAEIYRDLSPPLLAFIRARGAAEPEDLTGEVFVQIVRDVPRFSGDERDFRAWCFAIARHRLIDEGRRRSRRPVDLAPDAGAGVADTGDVAVDALEAIADDRVRRLIEALAPDQRDVLLLRILGDLAVAEVARVIGKSPGAVKALQRRGLAALSGALSAEGVPL
jgi:RNA polymerase sigma factor (sigma-70 family)